MTPSVQAGHEASAAELALPDDIGSAMHAPLLSLCSKYLLQGELLSLLLGCPCQRQVLSARFHCTRIHLNVIATVAEQVGHMSGSCMHRNALQTDVHHCIQRTAVAVTNSDVRQSPSRLRRQRITQDICGKFSSSSAEAIGGANLTAPRVPPSLCM